MMQAPWTDSALNGHSRLGIRLLVASYFLAVGFGLVPGTGLQGLTGLILPEPAANLLAGIVVLVIACMILADRWVLISALSLSTLLFVSSYVTMVQIGVVDELGQFWRDIALIGALLLAHTLPKQAPESEPVKIFSKPGLGRGVVGEMVPAELRLNARHSLSVWRSTRHAPAMPPLNEADEITNIFATGT
jgi:uncharacterized membrane protein YphA (DoxX/SURF4 family)